MEVDTALEGPVSGRRRGRPRKAARPVVASSESDEPVIEDDEPVSGRRRGRLRKAVRPVVASSESDQPLIEKEEPVMGRRRGRPSKAVRPVVAFSESDDPLIEEDDDDDEGMSEESDSPRRGKGRGKRRGRPSKSALSEMKITCISVPVCERDDEEVECKLCDLKTTFRDFRIHNMQNHSNIATTTDDATIPEHKFYERRLKEFAKFTKSKTFKCPMNNCRSNYKSSLGLAYHLETCGKTKQEIERCLVECDQCGKKLTAPNLNWHKKSQHKPPSKENEAVAPSRNDFNRLKTSRKSAIKARKTIVQHEDDEQEQNQTIKTKKKKQKDADFVSQADAFDIEFGAGTGDGHLGATKTKSDFTTNATAFITSKLNSNEEGFWNRPARITADPFESVSDNLWTEPKVLTDYLPSTMESLPFKTIFQSSDESPKVEEDTITKGFRKLALFKGEVLDCEEGNLVFNAGGPVFGLSWHPSGRLLAVSTGKDSSEDLDYKIRNQRKASIQIYSHHHTKFKGKKRPIHYLRPQLVICSNFGYATHIQWCNFWPKCWDNYDAEDATFHSTNKSSRIGHLSCCFEDGTLRIYVIRVADLGMRGNYRSDNTAPICNVPVYNKMPETSLEIDTTIYQNVGQICKYEIHEENRFVIAGYSSGLVAVFALQSTSSLLLETRKESSHSINVIFPFWTFQAHLSAVTGLNFDPMSSRYFVSASKDRYLKLWDLHLRQELENRKVGLVTDTCWIRGWLHIAVATDSAISNNSSQYNFVRFYQIGTVQARPNCAEFMDISSLSFHDGITIQGTENGNVTSTYFDNFWRELDFDRNKKKFNVVNICKLSVDTPQNNLETENESVKTDTLDDQQEPRIIFNFGKERVRSLLPDPKPQDFDDHIRYFSVLRVNKVAWCPLGGYFAVGYRNGLLTIIPASFDSLYR